VSYLTSAARQSSRRSSAICDGAARSVHDGVVGREIRRWDGREIDASGDGWIEVSIPSRVFDVPLDEAFHYPDGEGETS